MTAPLEDTPLRQLLERVARGEVSIDEAAGRLVRTNVPEALPGAGSPGLGSPDVVSPGPASGSAPVASEGTASAMVDLDRWRRCGYPEVVYGRGNPPPRWSRSSAYFGVTARRAWRRASRRSKRRR